jgi:hypothetical protein
VVRQIASKDGDGQTWWVNWTGLAADAVKSGFFASVRPTMDNQCAIAAALAILVSARAAIIEKGRCDTLSWIEWATQALYQTRTVVTDLTFGWKMVQAVGQAATIIGRGRIVTPTGASVALAGFLAEALAPETHHEEFRHTTGELLALLDEKIAGVHSELDGLEAQFDGTVQRLRSEIYATHSYNLELYDLTANQPEGSDRDPGGFQVAVDEILRLAEHCYGAADGYQGLAPIVAGTSLADRHLAGRDRRPTRGDMALLGVRDQFEQFLKTTCARYLVAADQVRSAARAYAELEDALEKDFRDAMNSWDDYSIGQVEVGFDPGAAAHLTDRELPQVGSVLDFARMFDALTRREAQGDDYVVEDKEEGE